jgi:hypothetical protein
MAGEASTAVCTIDRSKFVPDLVAAAVTVTSDEHLQLRGRIEVLRQQLNRAAADKDTAVQQRDVYQSLTSEIAHEKAAHELSCRQVRLTRRAHIGGAGRSVVSYCFPRQCRTPRYHCQ